MDFLEVISLLVQRRQEGGRFPSLEELRRRAGVSRRVIMQLADADAFSSFQRDRRAALWEALAQEKNEVEQRYLSWWKHRMKLSPICVQPAEEVEMVTGQQPFVEGQPIMFWRSELDQKRVLKQTAADSPDNKYVRWWFGAVTSTPAQQGITFVTLEDETGTINLVIRPYLGALLSDSTPK